MAEGNKCVKSNSAHFNGAKNGTGKGLLSGDSSCRIVSTMGAKGDTIQKDKEIVGKDVSTGKPKPAPSDCSISPNAAPKLKRRGRKEKTKPTLAVQPTQIVRALFKQRTRVGAVGVSKKIAKSVQTPRNMVAKTVAQPILMVPHTKEDVDLMDFIYMDWRKPDVFESFVVANCEGIQVSGIDLQCLRPTKLMYNVVINMFAEYMNEQGSEDWFLSAYFSGSALGVSEHMSREDWILHTIRCCVLRRFAGRIGNCRRIFIPMR